MTKIPWTEITINPWVGCTKIAAGCLNCYAEQMARRLRAMGHKAYADVIGPHGKWTGRIGYQMDQLDKLHRLRKPRMIFICSMSDPFHEDVQFEKIRKVLGVIDKCRQHTFQLLTKRLDVAVKVFGGASGVGIKEKPRPNLWLGTSISTQADADKNIPILLQIPAAVRFLSIEPMLEEINLHKIPHPKGGYFDSLSRKGGIAFSGGVGLDWVIIGCESGPKRRPCKLEWIEDAVRQCVEANVPVFVKQLEINGKVSHNPKEWPKWAQRQEYPK